MGLKKYFKKINCGPQRIDLWAGGQRLLWYEPRAVMVLSTDLVEKKKNPPHPMDISNETQARVSSLDFLKWSHTHIKFWKSAIH